MLNNESTRTSSWSLYCWILIAYLLSWTLSFASKTWPDAPIRPEINAREASLIRRTCKWRKISARLIQGSPICFFTHFSSPPDAMISCTLSGSAPTFWLQVGPLSPSFTVTTDRDMSQVNVLIEDEPSFSILWGNAPGTCPWSQLWLQLRRRDFEITYQPVLLVNFFSFSGTLWGPGGGESKDSRFSDGSFCCEPTAAEEKYSRSLCTSLGTSTIKRPLLTALRPKVAPKLPTLPSQIPSSKQDEGFSEKMLSRHDSWFDLNQERGSSVLTRRTCYYKGDLFSKDRGSGLLSPVITKLVSFHKDDHSIRRHVSGPGKFAAYIIRGGSEEGVGKMTHEDPQPKLKPLTRISLSRAMFRNSGS